jgi:hypothetical protein
LRVAVKFERLSEALESAGLIPADQVENLDLIQAKLSAVIDVWIDRRLGPDVTT